MNDNIKLFDIFASAILDRLYLSFPKCMRQVHTIRDLFLIKKPDLLGKSKWTLIYDRAIDVTIADETFIQRVKNREVTIGHGDRLDADLLIETFLDMEDMEVIETRYTVTRVYGVIPPQTQDNPPLLA